ncbi:MAG TPA: gliding motility-associated C-terminal domain-containing protein, partial [Puia sp.]|nr:gliding motility-associated C-terminal domain-containing protein [Puia sp.]
QVNGADVGRNSPVFISSALSNGSKVQCIVTGNAPCASAPIDSSNIVGITIINLDTPAIAISDSDSVICAGFPVTFSAHSSNAGAVPSYQWLVNGTAAGSDSSSFTSSTLNNGDLVSCILTSNAACATVHTVTSDPLKMDVSPTIMPTVSISASANNMCSGIPVVFTATPTNGGNAPAFQWLVNGIGSGGDSAIFTSSALRDGDIVYCIMASSLACATADSSTTVHMVVYPLPLVAFNPDTVYTPNNNGVQLTPITTGAITQYQWSPAPGLSGTNIETPVANPVDETTYQLLVTTDHGCTVTGKVTVIAGRPLEIPSAFTPNGDGHNDVFRIPLGVQFNLEELDIFNRWGTRVFTSRDIRLGWDGTYHGAAADAGTYVYMISGKTPEGKSVFLKGTVVLIR